MSSDSVSLPMRRFSIVLGLGLAVFLSACQVRPLYEANTPTAGRLASIGFSAATDRITQEVRNSLIFLTSGGAGETANPEYKVELVVTASVGTPLLDDSSTMPKIARLTLVSVYKMTRVSDGTILRAASRQAVALYDYPAQEFAKLRAKRDAENRAAKELAEIIRADLAGYLGRGVFKPQLK
ncbi:MAG: hypothetical protein ACOH2J_11015 [Allorhizobium sp.]